MTVNRADLARYTAGVLRARADYYREDDPMTFTAEPDTAPRRQDRKTCAYCEASAAGCRSNEWLRGRRCCEVCSGDHDQGAAR